MWKHQSLLIPVKIREHVITNYRWQIVASGNKLTESSPGRAEGVEFLYGKATFGVSALEDGNFERRSSTVPGATGLSIRGMTSMLLALNRTCHLWGGEITTSPPMNSLQCM